MLKTVARIGVVMGLLLGSSSFSLAAAVSTARTQSGMLTTVVYVNDFPVTILGESNHNDLQYRLLSKSLQHLATDRKIAFFREALPRDVGIEQLWNRFTTADNVKDSGWFFGLEDDLVYLISDWVVDIGRYQFSDGERLPSQNDNFLFKFVLSHQAIKIWNAFLASAESEPFRVMTEVLDPQIRQFVVDAQSGEFPVVSLNENFTPEEWARLEIALLQVAVEDSGLTDQERVALEAYLEHPLNRSAIVAFNDHFGRKLRSERMVANIKATLATLSPDIPAVILVGAGHFDDLVEGLKSD